jgi:hypothetical protein
VDPHQEDRVQGSVAIAGLGHDARDELVDGVDAANRVFGSEAVAEHDRPARAERPSQAGERICSEVGVGVHPGGDGWMGDLHQQRAGAAGEDDALAVDAPRDGAGLEEAVERHAAGRTHGHRFGGVSRGG